MLTLHLKPIFKERGILNPHAFLVKAGISRHSVENLLNGSLRTFRLDHIEILCSILICEPNDLLKYTPNRDHPISSNHPLNNLIEVPSMDNYMTKTLANLPLKELKVLNKQLNEQKK